MNIGKYFEFEIIKLLENIGYDCNFSLTVSTSCNFKRCIGRVWDNVNWDINKRPMRQDIDDCYVENGALYITTKKNLEKSGLRYSGKIGIYKMPFSRSLQVDTLDDLLLIEKVMSTE